MPGFRVAAVSALFCTLIFAASSTPGLASGPDKPVALPTPVLDKAPQAQPLLPDPKAEDLDDTDLVAQADHATLAAAVAAQGVPDAVDDDLRCLAGAIYFESKGEPLAGQLAVAHVILNRTESGRFPTSICAVVKQPGQFSFVRGGAMPSIPDNHAYRTAIAVAQVAMADAWENPVEDALYFHAARVSPQWGKRRVAAIGNHIFYR